MLGVSAHFSFNNLKMAIFNRNKLANTFFEYFFFSTQLPEDNNVLTHATNYSGRIWYAEFGNWLMGVLGSYKSENEKNSQQEISPSAYNIEAMF